ncbi:sigma-54-dependent transcriptional regulator [Fodinibius sp. SL11]|uniref:sigma-54-dependent transcriptional regulator n=1 Tax=Fodinibius sp. SL11 TaxID=3425690 RepID=UPI003F880B6F
MIASMNTIGTKNALLKDIEKSFASLLMQDIFHKVLQLAKLDSNVFIVGEIGSGKKKIAEIIHQHSKRANKPFFSFYCVDINEEDYKDTFWGHLNFDENQLTLKYEALEQANGGILYLDQFSELSQKYMVNIIASVNKGINQLYRLDKTSIPRLVLSFNQESYRDLTHSSAWDTLLAQLDPVVIMLPPLRERKEDIPILINNFLNEIRDQNKDYKNLRISAEALYDCFNYNWPGNIRQLKNAIMQGAILSLGETIKSEHLPFSMSWKLPYKIDANYKNPNT